MCLRHRLLCDFMKWSSVNDWMRQHNVETMQRAEHTFTLQKQNYIPEIYLKPSSNITFVKLDVSGHRLVIEHNRPSHHLPFPFISLPLSLFHCWNNHQLPLSLLSFPQSLAIFQVYPAEWFPLVARGPPNPPLPCQSTQLWETDSSTCKSIIIFRQCNPIPEDIL